MTSSDRRLDIGTTESGDDFTLPAQIAVQASATMGKRGTGKTVTATVLVEEMLKQGLHVVVIDPVDVWWGLKASGDGEEEGFPILTLGGPHGDLPLRAEHGEHLADVAVEERVPMILSLRHLRKGEQRGFVTDFAEQLYHRKGEPQHRVPLHLVVDEASRFIPQRVTGDIARSVGAFQDIVRQGRADGFGVNLIDQRPATVNKNVLSQVDTLVVHKVTSPHDRKALTEWVEQHDAGDQKQRFLDRLASLELGQAWFWDPGLDVFDLVDVRMRETFDSSSTPDLGEEVVLPETMASVDIDELREALEEQIEEAERTDPERLMARIEELEGEKEQLRERLSSASEQVPEDYVSHETMTSQIDAAVKAAKREARQEWEGHVSTLEGRMSEIGDRAETIREAASDIVEIARRDGRPERDEGDAPEASSVSRETRTEPSADDDDLGRYKRALLQTLRDLEALGVETVERENLAAFAGYSHRSSAFRRHLSEMEDAGMIDYPTSGSVMLLGAGRKRTDPPETSRQTTEDLHRGWMRNLDGYQGALLRELIDAHPSSLSREELADRAGYSATSSAFRANVATLEQMGAVVYPESGYVRASELLFPENLD